MTPAFDVLADELAGENSDDMRSRLAYIVGAAAVQTGDAALQQAALPLLLEWREALHSSQVRADGSLPTAEQHEIERFDRAIALIDRALKRHRAAKKKAKHQ
jgi:hypothetical protein